MPWLRKDKASIGVLDIHGRIDDASATALVAVLQSVDWAAHCGLIIKICSNGGSLGAAQAICEAIQTVRSEAGIYCVSLVLDTALSAAFYVALAADRVMASPAATLGNVGALAGRVSFHDLGARFGVDYRPVASVVGKGTLHPLAPSGAEEHSFRGAIDDAHEQFLAWIVQTRGVPVGALSGVDQGQVITGRQALAMRLVDVNGGLFAASREVGAKMGKSDVRLAWLNKRPSNTSSWWGIVKRFVQLLRGA